MLQCCKCRWSFSLYNMLQCYIGVIDEGPSGPHAQFAAQMAQRAVLDRRCDEVSVSVCLSVCLSVLLPLCLSVCVF